MALIDCPECSQKVSDTAPSCPGCGHVFQLPQKNQTTPSPPQTSKTQNSRLIFLSLVIAALLVVVAWFFYKNSSSSKALEKAKSTLIHAYANYQQQHKRQPLTIAELSYSKNLDCMYSAQTDNCVVVGNDFMIVYFERKDNQYWIGICSGREDNSCLDIKNAKAFPWPK